MERRALLGKNIVPASGRAMLGAPRAERGRPGRCGEIFEQDKKPNGHPRNARPPLAIYVTAVRFHRTSVVDDLFGITSQRPGKGSPPSWQLLAKRANRILNSKSLMYHPCDSKPFDAY